MSILGGRTSMNLDTNNRYVRGNCRIDVQCQRSEVKVISALLLRRRHTFRPCGTKAD